MSRCFPFPPPGYEKKPTTDDLDLLKKEKRKEKKHKKDKKDKEKKEGKEKREKDRSEGKHKDKKDKKDKHRDKKDKKDKEKGKTSTQDEGYNGEKLHHIHNNEQIQDKKQVLQFRNGESHKDRTSTSQPSTQSQGQNGDLARNRDTENYKFVQELDRRIRDEEKGTGSQQFFVEGRKSSYNKVEMQNSMARNKINGATPPPQSPLPPAQLPQLPAQPPLDYKIDRKFDQKEKMQESDDKRGDKRKNKDRDKQRAGKEKDGEKEKKEEKGKEKSERDKNKHIKKSGDSTPTFNNLSMNHLENSLQGIGSEGILKKRKDLETNGVFHENEARPNKMARPISNISPENGRKLDFPQNPNSSFLDNQRASQNSFKMGSSKSQKVNGIIPSPPLSLPPKKPPIPAFNHIHHKPSPIKSPPPPVITNHIATQSPPLTTTKPPPPPPPPLPSIPNPIPAQVPPPAKQPVSRPKPPPAIVKAAAPPPPPKKKPESVKPPHPDTKYLKEILSVPKPDEWGGVDDQEWLFKAAAAPPPPPEKAATMAEVQVWSEAKHIESVDVCALPYVIPY